MSTSIVLLCDLPASMIALPTGSCMPFWLLGGLGRCFSALDSANPRRASVANASEALVQSWETDSERPRGKSQSDAVSIHFAQRWSTPSAFFTIKAPYHDSQLRTQVHQGWAGSQLQLCVHARIKAATWLILPVVICLSQRLSHACLSINCLYCETANGSLNQL